MAPDKKTRLNSVLSHLAGGFVLAIPHAFQADDEASAGVRPGAGRSSDWPEIRPGPVLERYQKCDRLRGIAVVV